MTPEGYDFTGKVAIVTGGGTGIGAATARLLARYGANVAIAGRTEGTLSATAEAIQHETGQRCIWQQADISDEAQVDAFIASVIEQFGRIDVLVNNVGWGDRSALTETTTEAWRLEFARNLDTGFFCTRAVGPHMLAQGSGAVVNVSSVAGSSGVSGMPAYSTAKAALQMFTRVAAAEWGPKGVRVNCVAPGMIATENAMADFTASGLDPDAFGSHFALRRLGKAEDIARAIVFLASDAAAYVTGQTLLVAGGPGSGL